MNPLVLIISFISSLIFYLILDGWIKFLKYLLVILPIGLIIALTNPLFVHRGETILFTIKNLDITYEALIYGFSVAMMLVSIITWFKCYNKVVTMDKFVYLFGGIFPTIATTISMGIAFIPRFIEKGKKINIAQKNLGLYGHGFKSQMKLNLRIFSSLISWGLENSIDTADSMSSRGYGLKGKTRFSLFRYTFNDFLLTLIFILLMIFIIIGSILKYLEFEYYPTLSNLRIDTISVLLYISISLFMLIPTAIELKEAIKWNFLKSKI